MILMLGGVAGARRGFLPGRRRGLPGELQALAAVHVGPRG